MLKVQEKRPFSGHVKNFLFISLKASDNPFQLSMLVLPLCFIFSCSIN